MRIDSATRTIKVYTADKSKIGAHDVVITVTLASYPAVPSKTITLKVNIDHCVVTSFTMQDLSLAYNRTYTLADQVITWSVVNTTVLSQVPACGYTEYIDSPLPTPVVITPGSTMGLQLV